MKPGPLWVVALVLFLGPAVVTSSSCSCNPNCPTPNCDPSRCSSCNTVYGSVRIRTGHSLTVFAQCICQTTCQTYPTCYANYQEIDFYECARVYKGFQC